MADLTAIERRLFEELFDMGGGYVLDFSNAEFEAFFRDHSVEIYQERYSKNGGSKAKP